MELDAANLKNKLHQTDFKKWGAPNFCSAQGGNIFTYKLHCRLRQITSQEALHISSEKECFIIKFLICIHQIQFTEIRNWSFHIYLRCGQGRFYFLELMPHWNDNIKY